MPLNAPVSVFRPCLSALVAGLLLLSIPIGAQTGEGRCTAHSRLKDLLAQDDLAASRWAEQESRLESLMTGPALSDRSLLIIPVVVHSVWFSEEQQVTDEEILEQIASLNADFRAFNCTLEAVPEGFRPFIADAGLEFCLATVDPAGNPTTGITRTPTFVQRFSSASNAIFHSSQGGADAWDTDRYLNIWVAPLGCGSTNGFATFPGMTQPGEDGVVIDPCAFGSGRSARSPYDLGRTLTHEVGHYLNLLHIWGDFFTASCDDDDGVEDTPLQAASYLGQCPEHPQISCGSPDMFMNFMDFTDDACMSFFTPGQADRMRSSLEAFRPGLAGNANCDGFAGVREGFAFSLYPNPQRDNLYVRPIRGYYPRVHVRIFDLAGRLVLDRPDHPTAHSVDTSLLPSGIYLVEVRCNGLQWAARMAHL